MAASVCRLTLDRALENLPKTPTFARGDVQRKAAASVKNSHYGGRGLPNPARKGHITTQPQQCFTNVATRQFIQRSPVMTSAGRNVAQSMRKIHERVMTTRSSDKAAYEKLRKDVVDLLTTATSWQREELLKYIIEQPDFLTDFLPLLYKAVTPKLPVDSKYLEYRIAKAFSQADYLVQAMGHARLDRGHEVRGCASAKRSRATSPGRLCRTYYVRRGFPRGFDK